RCLTSVLRSTVRRRDNFGAPLPARETKVAIIGLLSVNHSEVLGRPWYFCTAINSTGRGVLPISVRMFTRHLGVTVSLCRAAVLPLALARKHATAKSTAEVFDKAVLSKAARK